MDDPVADRDQATFNPPVQPLPNQAHRRRQIRDEFARIVFLRQLVTTDVPDGQARRGADAFHLSLDLPRQCIRDGENLEFQAG